MSAEQIYRVLLWAYPAEFRAEYGREMVLLFRDQCREGDARTLGFWAAVIGDVARSAPALRAEAWRANLRTFEVIMKLTAILIVLVGVFGILNVVIEWQAGGTGTTRHALALMLSIAASALLLVAGAAIMRSTGDRQAGRVPVLASLVMIVAARLLHPWMSVLAQLVGIGMPVAFLIALSWPRGASRTRFAGKTE